ncbi:MAG: alcohol dehydrogenase family protein [Pseudomonadota bacterium]
MPLQQTMQAVVLTGHGGPERLSVEPAWPVPTPTADQVLIRVGACGVNNTDINTRIGWYSKAVTSDTNAGTDGFTDFDAENASWDGNALKFPRIQGADVCGEVVAVGSKINEDRIGERVLVRAMQPVSRHDEEPTCITFGSEMDGGFCEYAVAPAAHVLAVDSPLTDAELASFPCAASTALGMLERINLKAGEHILVTGASGGVGSAAIQLAKARGCTVSAISSPPKFDFVRSLGASDVYDRDEKLPANTFDVVADLVAGAAFPSLLEALKRGGRYITAGAISGPIVELDVRTLYLKDLALAGSTFQPPEIFTKLIAEIEKGSLKPTVSKTYPLSNIAEAQADFVSKAYPGKLVLIPDSAMAQSSLSQVHH